MSVKVKMSTKIQFEENDCKAGLYDNIEMSPHHQTMLACNLYPDGMEFPVSKIKLNHILTMLPTSTVQALEKDIMSQVDGFQVYQNHIVSKFSSDQLYLLITLNQSFSATLESGYPQCSYYLLYKMHPGHQEFECVLKSAHLGDIIDGSKLKIEGNNLIHFHVDCSVDEENSVSYPLDQRLPQIDCKIKW